MNKKYIIINLIAIAILIALVAVISVFLTNRKEATSVETNNNQLNSANNSIEVFQNNTTIDSEGDSWFSEENGNTSITPTNTTETKTTPSTKTVTPSKENKNNNTSVQQKSTPSPQPTKVEPTKIKAETNSSSSVDINKLNAGIKTERKGVIYLTFDDGPSEKITPQILDILKSENVKATFFVINWSSGNENLIKREAQEGHTIGIHGYSHEYSKIYKSKDSFMDNVYSLQKRIKDITGITSTYTRFPGGSSNTVSKKYCKGIMTELAKEMINKGFKYFDWNVSSGDAGGAKNATAVYNNVTKNLKKDRQNMVLMHDFSANQKGADALRDIIKFGKDNGYTFMAIDDKTPFFAQHISN